MALAAGQAAAPRPARVSNTSLRPLPALGPAGVSAQPVREDRPADAIAGLLAALALFASLIGIAYRPVCVIPFAIVLALIATAMGGRHARLAAAAVFVGGLCFIVGLALAVITNNPIF